ncbi:Branch, WSC, and/or Xylo C domain containing protein, partial [Asbolus verrucosus]
DWHPQSQKATTQSVENNRKKVITVNATILRLDDLDFKPQCEINGKEAVSAIHRAKTQRCKQLIANVSCQSPVGTLYSKHLSGSCPSGGKVAGKALGCFKDENNYRLLTGYFGVYKKNNLQSHCIQICLQSGFEYAGVQYSNECFCGNDEPPSIYKLPDSSCNMKCPGDSHATCGGYYTINIYQTGIKKFIPQVANTKSPPSDEEHVKIVFLLTLNGRAIRQREYYLFCELLFLERRFPNIRLTRRRFATIWGNASLLEMLLSCMSELLNMSSWKWDFVLNLSESDYPVKMVSSLERFLSANRGHNFVKSHGRGTQRFLQKQGLDKTFVECDMRMWRVADRHLPNGLQMDGGSDWIALSRKFINYVAAPESDDLVTGLKQVFKHTLLPAESFFHTVLRNSRFCNTYIDNNLHVTNWKRKLGCKCQYKHVVDWCGCSSNDFRPNDWPRIQTTLPTQLYFARKFKPIINQAILLKLELWLHGLEKPSRKVVNLNSYWQSMYHHLDLSSMVDDGVMTIICSVGRVWLKSVTNGTCTVVVKKPIEATSYHLKDSYKHTLVHFKAEIDSLDVDIEVAFRPINMTYLVAPSSLTKRLEELTVSKPVIVYKFFPGDVTITYNISCLWIDLTGMVVEMTDISVDENPVTGHSKPSMRQPHLPGAWTVKLIYQQVRLAEAEFLITPLEFFSGAPLTKKQAWLIHGGSLSNTVIENYDKFLDSSYDKSMLKPVIVSNSKKKLEENCKTGSILLCGVKKAVEVCGLHVEECFKTGWSSHAPDPKSFIGNINQTSGTFDIW